MLNISHINVIKRGIITGIISKMEFTQKQKQEKKLKKKLARQKFINMINMDDQTPYSGLLDRSASNASQFYAGVVSLPP